MPNWCEGTLKVRGEFERIKEFILKGLNVYSYIPLTGASIPTGGIKETEYSDDEYCEIDISDIAYIEGTQRAFALKDTVHFYKREGKPSIVEIPIKQAWDMLACNFKAIAKKYNIDMHLFGFEQGGEFSREIVIENGIIMLDITKGYQDYKWDCPFSKLGG